MKHYITEDSEKTCVEEIASLQTRLTDAEKQRDAYKQEAEFNEDSCKRNQRGWEASEKEKSEMMLKYASAIAANATLQSERDKARAMRDNFLINGKEMAHVVLKLKAKLAKAKSAIREKEDQVKAMVEKAGKVIEGALPTYCGGEREKRVDLTVILGPWLDLISALAMTAKPQEKPND